MKEEEEEESEFEMAIPHLFRCPISLDLFTDPVTLSTGQTYDRRNIERWLQLGNLTCPVTMQKLQHPFFFPNNTLRHLIDQWLTLAHGVDPNFFQRIDPHRSLLALKQCLQSNTAPVTEKLNAIEKVQGLSEQSPSRSPCLLRLGFLPLLLETVFKEETEYPTLFFEVVLTCVVKLVHASTEPESSTTLNNILKDESKSAAFVALFEGGTPNTKKSLCRLVETISSSPGTKDLCTTLLAERRRFLRELINLLLNRNIDVSESGIKAIWSLSSTDPTRQNLVHEGVVDALVTHIKNVAEKGWAPLAMATLERFIGIDKAKEALISNRDGIRCVVKMVFRVSDIEGSESALNLLTAICEGSLRAREDAIGAGVLTQLLFLLQSQCSGRIKSKARMLLKLLRSKTDEAEMQKSV